MYWQIVDIPMVTNHAPLVADLFLFCYEREYICLSVCLSVIICEIFLADQGSGISSLYDATLNRSRSQLALAGGCPLYCIIYL